MLKGIQCVMIKFLFLIVFLFILFYLLKFYKNEEELKKTFELIEKKSGSNLICIVDKTYKSYILNYLNKKIISIDQEETNGKFSKILHKLSGSLILIINFNKCDSHKINHILKSLESYSKSNGNILTTYIPYKTTASSSLLSLSGKNIIFGSYATLSNVKIEDSLSKILSLYYSSSTVKKIIETFNIDSNLNTVYSFDDLNKLKINIITEDSIHYKFKNLEKSDLKNLMNQIDELIG